MQTPTRPPRASYVHEYPGTPPQSAETPGNPDNLANAQNSEDFDKNNNSNNNNYPPDKSQIFQATNNNNLFPASTANNNKYSSSLPPPSTTHNPSSSSSLLLSYSAAQYDSSPTVPAFRPSPQRVRANSTRSPPHVRISSQRHAGSFSLSPSPTTH